MLRWAWTIGTGLLLIVVGFTVGVVAGIASEEPALVVGHLAGRGQDVPWARLGESPQIARQPAPVAARPGTPRDLPGVAAAPPGRSAFSVQVGAFESDFAARAVAQDLLGKGFPSYVTPAKGPQDGRWRVRVGPYRTREDAEEQAARLKQDEKLPTWVLNEAA